MNFHKIFVSAALVIASSFVMAEPAPRVVDLGKLYALYQKSGYSSLELMESNTRVLISGVVQDVGQSFNNNPILKVGVGADSQELARLVAADDFEENHLKSLRVGAKFKAVCDLTFTSGSNYMSFQACVFR